MVESWPSLSLWLLVSAGAGNVNHFHTWFLFSSSLEPVYFTWSSSWPLLPYLIFLQLVSISFLPSQLFLSLHIFFSLDNILFPNALSYSFLKCLYIPSKMHFSFKLITMHCDNNWLQNLSSQKSPGESVFIFPALNANLDNFIYIQLHIRIFAFGFFSKARYSNLLSYLNHSYIFCFLEWS